MAFKIRNCISEDDYRLMAELLSDKSLMGEVFQGHIDAISITINVIRYNALESPLSWIGRRYLDKQICSEDAESYSVCIGFDYNLHNNNFEKVMELLVSRVPHGFSLKRGVHRQQGTQKQGSSQVVDDRRAVAGSNLDLYKESLGYRVARSGRTIKVSTIRERKITPESIKADLEAVFSILESMINGVYELEGSEVDLEVAARLSRGNRPAREDMSKKIEKVILLEKPSTTFKEIGGCEEAKSELMLLGHGLQNPQAFEKWGISYPRGILLHGPPGTGKTLLAKAMANLAQAALFSVSLNDVLSMWYGQSPKLVASTFETAQKNSPAIILFDEIDSLAQSRDYAHEETVRIVSVFLQKMDGIKAMDRVTVIGTTNALHKIDRALLRPGRFDKIIEVLPPDKEARAQIFRLHCSGKRVDEDLDYSMLASKSENFTGADIAEAIQIGLGKKLKEELRTGRPDIPPLSTDDLLISIEEYKKRMDSAPVRMMPSDNKTMYA